MRLYLGVAQFGSALEWGSRGRKFKSSHSDHYQKSNVEKSALLFCLRSAQEVFLSAGRNAVSSFAFAISPCRK